MAGITSALENLVSAIFGILNNILNSLLAVLQSIFAGKLFPPLWVF